MKESNAKIFKSHIEQVKQGQLRIHLYVCMYICILKCMYVLYICMWIGGSMPSHHINSVCSEVKNVLSNQMH